MTYQTRHFYATNARQLLENRQQGFTTEGPVVVSLVGGEFTQTALFVHPDMPQDRMDWRMLVNLPVWVWASAKTPLDRLVENTWRIAQARPKELIVRFEHGNRVHDVDVGSGHHSPGVADILPMHQFWWVPTNVGSTALGARIKKALVSKNRYGEML